jgi:hypothetical protein
MIHRYVIASYNIDHFLEKVSKFEEMEILSIIKTSNDHNYEIFIKASDVNCNELYEIMDKMLWG